MKEKNESGTAVQFREKASAIGTLKYTVYRNGVLVEEVEEQNLIVTAGRSQMAGLLAGDGAERHIAKIAFGTNGNPPALADLNIANAFVKKINASMLSANAVQFDWSLSTTEANGLAILEFGLVCADDTLFSRRVRESEKPIHKEEDISLEGTWTIEF